MYIRHFTGSVYDKFARKKSVRKTIKSTCIPDKEEQLTTKEVPGTDVPLKLTLIWKLILQPNIRTHTQSKNFLVTVVFSSSGYRCTVLVNWSWTWRSWCQVLTADTSANLSRRWASELKPSTYKPFIVAKLGKFWFPYNRIRETLLAQAVLLLL